MTANERYGTEDEHVEHGYGFTAERIARELTALGDESEEEN